MVVSFQHFKNEKWWGKRGGDGGKCFQVPFCKFYFVLYFKICLAYQEVLQTSSLLPPRPPKEQVPLFLKFMEVVL